METPNRFDMSLGMYKIALYKRQRPTLSVKTLTMAPGGVETSVLHNTIVPDSAQVDFSFDTPGMRIFKLISLKFMGSTLHFNCWWYHKTGECSETRCHKGWLEGWKSSTCYFESTICETITTPTTPRTKAAAISSARTTASTSTAAKAVSVQPTKRTATRPTANHSSKRPPTATMRATTTATAKRY